MIVCRASSANLTPLRRGVLSYARKDINNRPDVILGENAFNTTRTDIGKRRLVKDHRAYGALRRKMFDKHVYEL